MLQRRHQFWLRARLEKRIDTSAGGPHWRTSLSRPLIGDPWSAWMIHHQRMPVCVCCTTWVTPS